MPFELDIAAIAAILLFLSILVSGIFLWVSDKNKSSTPVSVPPWSIGWVNFGLFICALIISISLTQSLATRLLGMFTEPVAVEEAHTGEQSETVNEFQPTEETEPASQNPWIWVLSVLSLQIPMILVFFGLRKTYPEIFGGSLNRKSVPLRKAIAATVPYFVRCFPIIALAGLIWFYALNGLQKLGLLNEFPPQPLITIISDGGNPFAIGLLVIFAIALAPFAEEIFFRGAIYRFVKGETHILNAQMISGVLFAAVHFNLNSFLPLLVIGILLARIYEQEGNILFPMLFHAYWNGFSLLMLFLTNHSKFSFQ